MRNCCICIVSDAKRFWEIENLLKHKIITITTIAYIIFAPTHSSAEVAWNCHNADVEISCVEDSCDLSTSHTPMSVRVSVAGQMEICAYTVCWSGTAESILVSGNFMTLTASDLKATSTSKSESVEGTVTLNTSRGHATIMIENFAHPMSCAKIPMNN